ncbi:hypothetical protein P4E94_05790 [Pontiellaceae bacterium B12219]|nr:hypothetical protein [Pontiellaceae bacterium B12219]
MKINFLLASLLGLSAASFGAAASDSLDMAVSGWAGWMRGNVVVNGQNAKIHRDSEDYFGDLNYGGSAELSIKNSSMVLLGSVDYLDNITSEVTVGALEGSLESSEIIGCVAVGYPMGSGTTTFDVLIGLQYLDMDNTLELSGGSPNSESETAYDMVLMVRYKQELFSSFYINIPLSIGGTYLSDSEFIYDAGVQLLYQFGDSFDLRAGYRISGYDFSDDAGATDFYQQGYTLGIGMTF